MALKKQKDKEIDRNLNAELAAGGWKLASPARKRELEAAARRTVVALKKRGGSRPGAGRKRAGTRPVLIRLSAPAEAVLRTVAKRRGLTLGGVIEQWAKRK